MTAKSKSNNKKKDPYPTINDTMAMARRDAIIAPLLATLSYLPFQLVAKITLIICVALFVIDPYPGSRLISLGAVGGVLVLHRMRERFIASSA
jgi:hypothetical protein